MLPSNPNIQVKHKIKIKTNLEFGMLIEESV